MKEASPHEGPHTVLFTFNEMSRIGRCTDLFFRVGGWEEMERQLTVMGFFFLSDENVLEIDVAVIVKL